MIVKLSEIFMKIQFMNKPKITKKIKIAIKKEKILYCPCCYTAFPYSKNLENLIKRTQVIVKAKEL
jgi:hypothetical protein